MPSGIGEPCLYRPASFSRALPNQSAPQPPGSAVWCTCEKRGSRLPSRRDHGMISTARGRSASRRIPYTVRMLARATLFSGRW